MAWTQEQKDRAKTMRADGYSASDVANELGVTRNAVCGQWARMGLSEKRVKRPQRDKGEINRQKVHRRAQAAARRQLALPGRPMDEPEITLDPDAIPRQQRRTMETIGDRHCRFPYGEPGEPDFFFCGAVRLNPERPLELGGCPYCLQHWQVAFTAPPKRRNVVPLRRSTTSVKDGTYSLGGGGTRWGLTE